MTKVHEYWDVQIYEWPGTGHKVELTIEEEGDKYLYVYFDRRLLEQLSDVDFNKDQSGYPWYDTLQFRLLRDDDGSSYVATSNSYSFDMTDERRKMLLGFLLDLGISRARPGSPSLVVEGEGRRQEDEKFPWFAPFPRWIWDEDWDQRRELFEAYVSRPFSGPVVARPSEPFLGLIHDLRVQDHEEDGVYCAYRRAKDAASSALLRPQVTLNLPTVDEVLDRILLDELLLPERDRLSWEAEHVLRGRFVLPTEEEADLYRAVGLPLPLLADPQTLSTWLEEMKRLGKIDS